jgi:hypothetical protein
MEPGPLFSLVPCWSFWAAHLCSVEVCPASQYPFRRYTVRGSFRRSWVQLARESVGMIEAVEGEQHTVIVLQWVLVKVKDI